VVFGTIEFWHADEGDVRASTAPIALHLQYNLGMKSSTIPSVRVEPELRDQLERVLQDGESLSAFVEAAVRDTVQRRLAQAEFVARGLASIESAKRSGRYVSATAVLTKLQARLDKARARGRRKTAASR
jgi:predicted transcriptional regulator